MVPYGLASHFDGPVVGKRRCCVFTAPVPVPPWASLRSRRCFYNPRRVQRLPHAVGHGTHKMQGTVVLQISHPTVRTPRKRPTILRTLSLTVRDTKLRPSRDVKNQREGCEARCAVGAGKTQQCRFPANFELSAGFFRVCKNGLFLSHTVRRQGGAVFRRCGQKDSTKLS